MTLTATGTSPASSASTEKLLLQEALRAASRAAHHRIDHHPLLSPLARADLTLSHYQFVLQAQTWIHGSLQGVLEQALSRLCSATTFRVSDRLGWLKADCAFFKLPSLPLSPLRAPVIATPAALVGQLYVVEGSTLGGQVIARQLEVSLGLTAETGARMFAGHGANTAERWQSFWDFAAASCPAADVPVACAAAVELFAYFGEGFDRVLQDNEAKRTAGRHG
jgi:heme oxygenase